jgi:hypothetical protein
MCASGSGKRSGAPHFPAPSRFIRQISRSWLLELPVARVMKYNQRPSAVKKGSASSPGWRMARHWVQAMDTMVEVKHTTAKIAVGFVASFIALAGAIVFLLATKIVSIQIGTLMLVASVGLHLGFGILVAVYRLIDKLE